MREDCGEIDKKISYLERQLANIANRTRKYQGVSTSPPRPMSQQCLRSPPPEHIKRNPSRQPLISQKEKMERTSPLKVNKRISEQAKQELPKESQAQDSIIRFIKEDSLYDPSEKPRKSPPRGTTPNSNIRKPQLPQNRSSSKARTQPKTGLRNRNGSIPVLSSFSPTTSTLKRDNVNNERVISEKRYSHQSPPREPYVDPTSFQQLYQKSEPQFLSEIPLPSISSFEPSKPTTRNSAVQTDDNLFFSQSEHLKGLVASLTQKVQLLEHELRLRDDTVRSLTSSNVYLQQQTIGQLNLINQLMGNQRTAIELPRAYPCFPQDDYASLKSALINAESTIKEKDKVIDTLKYSPLAERRRERSPTSPEHEEAQARYELYKQRQRESVLGDLLKWNVPNKLYSNPKEEITAKITEQPSPTKFGKPEKYYTPNKDTETLTALKNELAKELREREKLQEDYGTIKYVVSPVGKRRRRQIESDIEGKSNTIRRLKDKIEHLESSSPSYYYNT